MANKYTVYRLLKELLPVNFRNGVSYVDSNETVMKRIHRYTTNYVLAVVHEVTFHQYWSTRNKTQDNGAESMCFS